MLNLSFNKGAEKKLQFGVSSQWVVVQPRRIPPQIQISSRKQTGYPLVFGTKPYLQVLKHDVEF